MLRPCISSVGVPAVASSFSVFLLLYGLLAAIDGYLMWRTVRSGPAGDTAEEGEQPEMKREQAQPETGREPPKARRE